jgi:hypothetical protein
MHAETIWVRRADVGARESSAERIDANQFPNEVHGPDVCFNDSQVGESFS